MPVAQPEPQASIRLEARLGTSGADDVLSMQRHNAMFYPSMSVHPVFMQLRVILPLAVDRTRVDIWVLRMQGNTSLLAVALSALLLWLDAAWALPGVWLLLLGHSFYLLGGLALPAFRGCGLLYQAAGLVALWPGGWGLEAFAGAMLVGNLGLAWAVWRERRQG